MLQKKYVLALDQGTTSSRAILFDKTGAIKSMARQPFEQIFPQPGWVEHDPAEIWNTQLSVAIEALQQAGVSPEEVASVGITNQRETTVVWDRKNGKPVCNAIVWQDRRTAGLCDQLRQQGYEETIKKKTGLVVDAYFSGTKVHWILENIPGAMKRAQAGELCFGTIDSWLIWNLTGGKVHCTDVTNASRTMLFNIHTLQWDQEILDILHIPRSMLPEVVSSSGVIAETGIAQLNGAIPIGGIAGDQQAALFGQLCLKEGMVKNTYGTGCFLMMNTGAEAVYSRNNLLTTVAWQLDGRTTYALEGSVFIAGAAVQWLRDGLKLIQSSGDVEKLAAEVPDNGGVYFVPALAGLGAPYWDPYARGTFVGITRGTTASHFARATLEAIAYQSADVMKAMEADAGKAIAELRVDGGAVVNNLLMQFQADVMQCRVIRPEVLETTALGAAYLAGLAVGFWKNTGELEYQWKKDRLFHPSLPRIQADQLMKQWHRAVERSRQWIEA
ncbi:MAG: glycerol kinase GlpK [Bacteroidales bacterium]|nr:glycerol kinase GlpK [Bacteroidales bacterium]